MAYDRVEDTCFYLRSVYLHLILSASKEIFWTKYSRMGQVKFVEDSL